MAAKFFFFYSTTQSGKTARLLIAAHRYEENGHDIAILVPRIDTRYGEGIVESKVGLRATADCIFDPETNLFEAVQLLIEQSLIGLRCIFVDEAQFMTRDQVWQLTDVVDKLNIPVLCYGLRTDFLGEPFGAAPYLMCWADKVAEIKNISQMGSGKKATMNVRIAKNGDRVFTGDQTEIGDHYRAVTRLEFKTAKHLSWAKGPAKLKTDTRIRKVPLLVHKSG